MTAYNAAHILLSGGDKEGVIQIQMQQNFTSKILQKKSQVLDKALYEASFPHRQFPSSVAVCDI